jgi:class 3 adenylate cyclase
MNTIADANLESVLHQTRWGTITQELFTNSSHYPIVLILLELIPRGRIFFIEDVAFYALLLAAGMQAYFLGSWQYAGKPHPLLGNLIGPALYSLVEVSMEGSGFFGEPRHHAYWLFALAIGLLQEVRLRLGKPGQALVLVESIVRTSILLAGYWIFRAVAHPEDALPSRFLLDDSNLFIALAIIFLGLNLGLSNLNAQTYLDTLKETARRLRVYSEWLLGRHLLSQVMADPAALSLHRQERAVLFMDIRGFTRWSEQQSPEKVVGMLNNYFEVGEGVWNRYQAIKVKHTGDEIMVIFPDLAQAVQAAGELCRQANRLLEQYGLAAGIGLHYGALVEGVMGSREVKRYDVIGDVVNTAKRICDQAAGCETLLSEPAYRLLPTPPPVGPSRQITAKGKEAPLLVYPLVQPVSIE